MVLLAGLSGSPEQATTVSSPAIATPSTNQSLSFAEAERLMNASSSLSRAANYAVQSAEAHERAAAGLYRPTVSLDAQLLHFRKTFDLSFSDALNDAQSQISGAIPGLLSGLPGLPENIISDVNNRLQAALPELFTALPNDIRLELDDTVFRPTVTALQPIYTGGAIPAIQRAASANVELAQARQKEARSLENVNLAQAYFGQILATESLKIAIETRDGFDLHLRNAMRMQEEGLISRAQMLQVEVARDTAQRQVNRAELDLQNSKATLANVVDVHTGISPSSTLFVNRDSIGPIETFYNEAARSNPRIAQAQAGQNLANAGSDLAKSRFKPSVYAFGTYNMNPSNSLPIEPDWAVGVGARYTLLSSLDRRRMVDAARAQSSAASEVERQARNETRLLVTRAYNQVELARRQFITLQSSLIAASENLRVQELGFREGESTAASVVDALNLLGTARLQRAAAAYEYDLSLAALLAASGNGQTLTHYMQRDDRIVAP